MNQNCNCTHTSRNQFCSSGDLTHAKDHQYESEQTIVELDGLWDEPPAEEVVERHHESVAVRLDGKLFQEKCERSGEQRSAVSAHRNAVADEQINQNSGTIAFLPPQLWHEFVSGHFAVVIKPLVVSLLHDDRQELKRIRAFKYHHRVSHVFHCKGAVKAQYLAHDRKVRETFLV